MAWLGPGGPKVPENRTNTNHQSPFPALSFSGANCAVKRSFTRGNRAEFFGRLSSVLLLCYEDCARLLKSTSYGSPGIIKRFQAANVLENGVASLLDWRGDFRSLLSESLVSRAACCQTAQFPAKFIGFCARFARKIHNSGMRCTVSYHCDECSIIPRHKRRNWRAFLSQAHFMLFPRRACWFRMFVKFNRGYSLLIKSSLFPRHLTDGYLKFFC